MLKNFEIYGWNISTIFVVPNEKKMNTSGSHWRYCYDLFNYKRRKTSKVYIGNLPMGGDNPVRVQSMTTTNTLDTEETVKQAVRIIESGADYVRITAQGRREAENFKNIKAKLLKQGYSTPLIADIHFHSQAAEIAARYVEKVRINPGNFAGTGSGSHPFTEATYQEGLGRIREKLISLLHICREFNTALRIGTNHGSLSERIMHRYGDTPRGMVESTMEFLRICKEELFHNVTVSIKASNAAIMVKTVRLLAQKMDEEEMHYPFHLGVTEAGEGEEGRIKSAVGIGALLNDGIGDTIRVSLTEAPETEPPVCRKLINYVLSKKNHTPLRETGSKDTGEDCFFKRDTLPVSCIGSDKVPVVVADLSLEKPNANGLPEKAGYMLNRKNGEWDRGNLAADFVYLKGCSAVLTKFPDDLGVIVDKEFFEKASSWHSNVYPLFTAKAYRDENIAAYCALIHFVCCELKDIDKKLLDKLTSNKKAVLIAETNHQNGFAEHRALCHRLIASGCMAPVIFKRSFKEEFLEDLQLKSACDLGGLFLDGFGNGIWINNSGLLSQEEINSTAFGILQASGVRTSKTEFISCPGCGRTLFNLQETALLIKQKLAHLSHLKIGVMGCIVNGPGEMGDVDYGYVGSAPGKVTLYKKQEIICRNIPENQALDALIQIIKENNDWIEPKAE